MRTFRESVKLVGAFIVAVLAVVAGVILYGWRRMREGVSIGGAKQKAEDDREVLHRAEETGDDEGVLAEWRKHR